MAHPHPTPEELAQALQAARATGASSPERLVRLRELVAACPTFTPAHLALARALLLTDEPGVTPEAAFSEVQRLLESAVQGSDRSAPALVELAHFLDTFRNAPHQARPLFEEGAARALRTLEDAWAGLLTLLTLEDSLPEALALAARAEALFPDSERLQGAIARAREFASTRASQP